MSRVLIFSPYASRPHLTCYEGTIAKACKLRGATVEYLLCDSLLPECDMHWDSFTYNRPRPFDLCQRCHEGARSRLKEMDLPFQWLGAFICQAEREHAFTWTQSLPPSEIRSAVYMGCPIGEWVLSSVNSYFRQYPPDMHNWRVVNVYRGFLYSACMVITGLRKYLASHDVDSALLFNGRQSITRVALEIFRESGIRFVTHEYPFFQDGHLMLKTNAKCWSPGPFDDFWQMWGGVPLTRPELEKTLNWLKSRRYGRGLSWYAFNNPYLRPVSIRKALNLSPDRRLMALFTSSTDETAGDSELEGPYESQGLWVQDVIDWVQKRNDVELIIRVHPYLAGQSGLGKAVDEFNFYKDLKSAAPSNTHVIMPDEALNSYALMDEADIGLTYGSSVGIEMAMLGKPIVLASVGFYENGSHVIVIRSREDLAVCMEKSLRPMSVREIRREAFRLAYYYVFEFEAPFPLVSKSGVMDVRLNYTDPDALMPGKEKTLDHACGFLMHGTPLFDPPDAIERARTTEGEDAFFNEFEQSLDPLHDFGYERLVKRTEWLYQFGRSVQGFLDHLPGGTGKILTQVGKAIYLPLLNILKRKI